MVMKKSSKKVEKDMPYALLSYVIGIVALVEAFISPLAGFVFAVVGLVFSGKDSSILALRGRKLSIIALGVSVLLLVFAIVFSFFDFSSILGTSVQ